MITIDAEQMVKKLKRSAFSSIIYSCVGMLYTLFVFYKLSTHEYFWNDEYAVMLFFPIVIIFITQMVFLTIKSLFLIRHKNNYQLILKKYFANSIGFWIAEAVLHLTLFFIFLTAFLVENNIINL